MEETLRPFVSSDSMTEARNNIFIEALYKFSSTLTAFDLLMKDEEPEQLKGWQLLAEASEWLDTAFNIARTMARRPIRDAQAETKRSIVEFRQWLQLEQWSVGSFEMIASKWEVLGVSSKAQDVRVYYASLYKELSSPYEDDEIVEDSDQMSPTIVQTHFNELKQTYNIYKRCRRDVVFENLFNQVRAFLQIIIRDRNLLVEYASGSRRDVIEQVLQSIHDSDYYLDGKEEFETFVLEHVRTKLNIGGSYANAFVERVTKSIKLYEQFEHASIVEKYLDQLNTLRRNIQDLLHKATKRVARAVSLWDCLKAFGIFVATPFIALADCFWDHSFTRTKRYLDFACKTVSTNPITFTIVAVSLVGSAVLIGLSAGAGLAVIPAVAACASHAAGAVGLLAIGSGASAYAGWCLRDYMLREERQRLTSLQMQSEHMLAVKSAQNITRSSATTRQQREEMSEVADHLRDSMASLRSRQRERQARSQASAVRPNPSREQDRLRKQEGQRNAALKFIRETVGDLAREDCEETVEQLQANIAHLETLRSTAQTSLSLAKNAFRASVLHFDEIESTVRNLFL